nr:hypothetical protein [Tanacetum cinerariifolium]
MPKTEGAIILFPTPDEIAAFLPDSRLVKESKGSSHASWPSKKRKLHERDLEASSSASELDQVKGMDEADLADLCAKTEDSLERDEGVSIRAVSAPSPRLGKRLGVPHYIAVVSASEPSHVGTLAPASISGHSLSLGHELKPKNCFGEADLSKDTSGMEPSLELRRSWCVEGHVRSGVISSVLSGGKRHSDKEAVSEGLDIDASSGFMLTYNSDNDIVEVYDDFEVNKFMEFVVKSSRIVTLCIVESSVHGTQLSTTGSNQQSNFVHATPILKVTQLIIKENRLLVHHKTKKANELDLPDDEKLRSFEEKVMGSIFGKVKRLSGEDESSESNDESSEFDEESSECDEDVEATPVENKNSFVDHHTCTKTQIHPHHHNATPKVLGHILKEAMSESSRIYKGKVIMTYMNARFKIDISYSQAWRAKCYALQLLRGTPEESFNELPLCCHNLKLKNQGTITHIETDDEDRFEIFFLAVGAVIRAFVLHMRPLIIIDGAHLKCEFLGTMYLAAAMDDFEERFSTLRDWLPSIANKIDMIGLEKWARVHFFEAKLAQRIAKSATWTVRPAANYLYNVVDYYKNATVDLNTRTCSCGQWQLSGLPCGHLIGVMRHLRQSSANQFAFLCFKTRIWRASYKEFIYDVGHPSEWDQPDGLIIVLPPVMDKRQPGRPRNRDRFRSKGEQITPKACTRCFKGGHNRHDCPSVVPSQIFIPTTSSVKSVYMASLADKAILSGAKNRPPMLEKDMYNSWKSRMELYMLNRQHGRMILEVTEDGVTRLKIYSELSSAKAIQ